MPLFRVTLEMPAYEFIMEADNAEQARAAMQDELDEGKFPDQWMGVDDEWEVAGVLQVGQGEPVMHVVAGELVCTEDMLRRHPEPIEEATP